MASTVVIPRFVTAQHLKDILTNPALEPGIDYLVVDVRDSDFAGGNIIGCRNIPAHEFSIRMQEILNELQSARQLYFHCMLSQVRGPKCAQKYANALNANNDSSQEIFILQGGYEEFSRIYGTDKQLVENVSFGY